MSIDYERDRLIMANVRRLIKGGDRVLNWGLCMDIFGTGSTTAVKRCNKMGLDPYSSSSKKNEVSE